MATTNYSYRNDESLGDIANKFNTSVLNLVKLNKWLQDPNDGHTYMFPRMSPTFILPHEDGSGNIDHYETTDESTPPIGEQWIPYRMLELVVPLIGNGNISIEDYWESVNSLTGISYNLLIDNIINDTNIISTDYDLDSESSFIGDTSSILPGKSNFMQGSSNYGIMNQQMNSYIDDYLGKYEGLSGYRLVDYASGLVGNYLQSQINAGAKNLNLYRSSGLYRALGSTYFSQYDEMTNKTYRNLDQTYLQVYTGRERQNFRGLRNTYYGRPRYAALGNPNIIKGQCTVIVNGKTLYMPCYPDGVTDVTNVDYTSQNVLGRSEPFQAYNNSGPRSIQFSFRMHREMTGNISQIEEIVRCIESSVYPNYNANSSSVAAVKTSVRIGNVIYISGIVTSQSTSWEGPIGPDHKYNMVTVSFTVTEVTGSPKTAGYVSQNGGFRNK